jgi:hypothetical protein
MLCKHACVLYFCVQYYVVTAIVNGSKLLYQTGSTVQVPNCSYTIHTEMWKEHGGKSTRRLHTKNPIAYSIIIITRSPIGRHGSPPLSLASGQPLSGSELEMSFYEDDTLPLLLRSLKEVVARHFWVLLSIVGELKATSGTSDVFISFPVRRIWFDNRCKN